MLEGFFQFASWSELSWGFISQVIFLLGVYGIGRFLFSEKNIRSNVFWGLTTALTVLTIIRWFR
jgi:hypothetical protein